MDLRDIGWVCVNWTHVAGWDPEDDFRELCNELRGSIKSGEFLQRLNDY
jgi:hypothetical protein